MESDESGAEKRDGRTRVLQAVCAAVRSRPAVTTCGASDRATWTVRCAYGAQAVRASVSIVISLLQPLLGLCVSLHLSFEWMRSF